MSNQHQDIIDRADGKYPNTTWKPFGTGSEQVVNNQDYRTAAIEAATHEREQHTFGFAEWCRENMWEWHAHIKVWFDFRGIYHKTTAELFAIYLTEKSKTNANNI